MNVALCLPWPHKDLSPNARVHWSKKAKAAKAYKQDCYFLAYGNKVVADRVVVSIRFSPPNKRRRDMDNMLASIKSGLDGLSMALGIDDSRFELRLLPVECYRGKVMVTVEAQ